MARAAIEQALGAAQNQKSVPEGTSRRSYDTHSEFRNSEGHANPDYRTPRDRVELSERDLRIVTGGLTARLACNAASSANVSGLMGKTNIATGQDWDTDYERAL